MGGSSGTAATMTQPAEGQAAAFAAALAARKETFLARLPRKLKLTVTALIVAGFVVPLLYGAPSVPKQAGHDESVSAPAESGHQAHARNPLSDGRDPSAPTVMPVEPIQLKNDAERKAAAMNDGTDGMAAQLSPAPDPALVEESPTGRLPRISVDGRKPWQVYARPFNFQDPRPRIAIVMMDMGLSHVATDAALRRLPPPVTFAFDSQARAVDDWLKRARQDGHETLLSVGMEPFDYPQSDPGPNSLLTNLANSDNIQRLISALRLGAGYVGVTTNSGSRFMSDSPKLMPIMQVLHDRGLLVLDSKIAAHSVAPSLAQELGVPYALSSREIDSSPDPASIDQALAQLEQSARLEGSVVGIASPLPVTMERIEGWSKHLAERGIVLAPLSAVVK